MPTPPHDPLNEPRAQVDLPEPGTESVCYRHTDRTTRLSCSRCGRFICGDCSTPATVGQHCPECVAEARRSAPRVRSAMTATAPVVMGLVIVNVIVYLIERAGPVDFVLRWALFPPLIADGEWWRLGTAMFLHSPDQLFHILFNMLVLWIYGPHVEQAFGSRRFIAVYLVAGFVASATSYTLSPVNSLGVGASGAIFGVAGALIVLFHNRRDQALMARNRQGLLAFIGINMGLGLIIPGIDIWAHIGGLAAGLVLGAGLDARRGHSPVALQAATFIGVAAVGLVMVVLRSAALS